jgi:outer membrane protein OmpA-like peptidoglycan-associated protein
MVLRFASFGGLVSLGLCSLVSNPALAQERLFLTGEAGVAIALNDPYGDAYAIGGVGAVGVFRSLLPQLALGARVGYGALTEEDNVGAGGYNFGLLTGVARVRPLAKPGPERATGLWVEGGIGVGRVEDETRLVLTPALGYTFPVGGLGVGPVARYLQVVEDDFDDARIGILGVELVLLDGRTSAGKAGDRDGDGIRDDRDRCPDAPETYNGKNDADGCPDDESASFRDDRLVLDERLFFDFASADLRPRGKTELDDIAKAYADSGKTWKSLRIQGHTDSRGSEDYNEELSRQRAEAVKAYLVAKGVPANLLDTEAYGERAPLVPGADTESEYQKNRRVEFVIRR